MQIPQTLKASSVVVLLAAATLAEERSRWQPVSSAEPAIEFQWYRPAKNSCGVSFRDLQLKTTTSLTASIKFLPHRGSKNRPENSTVELVLQSGVSIKHIDLCQDVTGVSIVAIGRE